MKLSEQPDPNKPFSPRVTLMHYDLAICGNDESAIETAFRATQQEQKTLVVFSSSVVSAWLKTKALQHLSAELSEELAGPLSGERLSSRIADSVRIQLAELATSLRSKGIDVLNASVKVARAGRLQINFPDLARPVSISANHIVIATGIKRAPFQSTPSDISPLTLEDVLQQSKLPATALVVGGGDYGSALSAVLQLAGIQTQLVTRMNLDSAALDLARTSGVEMADHPGDFPPLDQTQAEQAVIDCRGRIGLTESLDLQRIGIEADEHGQLWCGRHFETWCRGVYGVGDVVGFSTDSSLSAEHQARIVVEQISETTHKSVKDEAASPRTNT